MHQKEILWITLNHYTKKKFITVTFFKREILYLHVIITPRLIQKYHNFSGKNMYNYRYFKVVKKYKTFWEIT